MKKTVCLIFTLCWVAQFAVGQTSPLQIYSSNRFWKSHITPKGDGFKYGNTIIVKHPYLFYIYKDHIAVKNKEKVLYKINKVENKWLNETRYSVSSADQQPFLFIAYNDATDKTNLYGIIIIKLDKNGKWLTNTRFDVKKVK